jgi:integrase
MESGVAQVPITLDVKMTLRRLMKVRRLSSTQDASTRHVFTYAGRPFRRVSRSFQTALTNAGIVDFRFHDLRHCASTNLRRAEVDTATAMKIVGHTSEKMWKRYNAINERGLTQAVEKLNRYLRANTQVTLDGTDQPAHQAK